ncbi:hypothetical protein MKX03_000821, partial [Papaver bracteatum]
MTIGGTLFILKVHPYETMIKFCVTDASLTEFNLTSAGGDNTILHYSLAVNITVKNNNRIMDVSYDELYLRANCYGQNISLVTFTPSLQGHTKRTLLHAV